MQPHPEPPQRVIERGPIAEMLDRIPGDVRDPAVRRMLHAAKVEAHVAAMEGKPLVFDGFTVLKVLNRLMPNGDRVLHVEVEAEGLPSDANPFLFVNPPVVSRDGKENPERAFAEMVSDAVEGARKRAKGGR